VGTSVCGEYIVATTDIVLRVDSVSKKFVRGEMHDSLRDLIPAVVARLTGRAPRFYHRDERDILERSRNSVSMLAERPIGGVRLTVQQLQV